MLTLKFYSFLNFGLKTFIRVFAKYFKEKNPVPRHLRSSCIFNIVAKRSGTNKKVTLLKMVTQPRVKSLYIMIKT